MDKGDTTSGSIHWKPPEVTVKEPRPPCAGLAVGRAVHYVAYGTPDGEYQAGAHRAAIVVELNNVNIGEFVDSPEVTLAVFNPTGIHWNKARYSATPQPGTWHWPEFV